MIDQRDFTPPERGILPARFLCKPEEGCYVLWDFGDAIVRKTKPEVWAVFPYYADGASDRVARTRAMFVTGLLNGNRQVHEQIDVS